MERRGEVGKALLIQSVRSRRESQSLQLIQAGPSEMLVSELALFPTETWGGGGTWEATLSSNSLEWSANIVASRLLLMTSQCEHFSTSFRAYGIESCAPEEFDVSLA